MEQINAFNRTMSSVTQGNASTKGSGNALGMQDFMKLLSTQLANQDPMNPKGDTDFIAQMAQFTSLQTMQTMTEITYAQYGASMIGKKVVVAKYDENGSLTKDQGVVDSVQFSGGDCIVTVNGVEYEMSSIMEVVTEFKPEDPDPVDPDPEDPDPEDPDPVDPDPDPTT